MIYLRGAKTWKILSDGNTQRKCTNMCSTTQLLTPSQSVQRSLLQSSELPLVYVQRLLEDSPVLLPLPNWTDQILVAPDLPCKHNGRGHWAGSKGKLGNCLSFSLKTRKFQFKYVTLSTSHYHILSPLHPERLQQIQTGSMKRTPYGEMPQQWLSVARWTADASVPSHCECILATCFFGGRVRLCK